MNKRNITFGLVLLMVFGMVFTNISVGHAAGELAYVENQYEDVEFQLKCKLAQEEILENLKAGKITSEQALEEIQFLQSIRQNVNQNKNLNLQKNQNKNDKILLKNEANNNYQNQRYNEYCRNFFGVCDGTGQHCYNRNHNHHTNSNNTGRPNYEGQQINQTNNWGGGHHNGYGGGHHRNRGHGRHH